MSRSKATGHQARKRFGQNFLHDAGVIDRIVRAIHPLPGDALVEIGPGLGALTEGLLAAVPDLQVIELDRDLIPALRTQFFNYPQLKIHQADALQFDFHAIADGRPLRIVGNLPYNISTPLIFHLLSHAGIIGDMHFMLQKEVVARLAAVPGDPAYGRLSLMAQYYCKVQPLFVVGPGAFRPAPKVDSAIVRLVPHQQLPYPADALPWLEQIVRTAFSARRKMLRKGLAPYLSAEDWVALAIDDKLRPENLTLADYVKIANWVAAREGAA